jgi:hypothetical protein
MKKITISILILCLCFVLLILLRQKNVVSEKKVISKDELAVEVKHNSTPTDSELSHFHKVAKTNKTSLSNKVKKAFRQLEPHNYASNMQQVTAMKNDELEFMQKLKELHKPSPEAQQANIDGAEAKITLRVVDSQGNPVKDAIVTGGLYPKTEEVAEIVTGTTDSKGLFVIAGKTRSYIDYVVQKKGFETLEQGKYWVFRSTEEPCYQDGKWIPWNPIIEVTLRKKSL